jgi:hypothetical protein
MCDGLLLGRPLKRQKRNANLSEQRSIHPQDAPASCRTGRPVVAISDLAASQPGQLPKGPTCGVCITLDHLDDIEAAALRSLLANKGWRYTELSERLTAEGINLPAFVLSRHARGQCQANDKLRGA